MRQELLTQLTMPRFEFASTFRELFENREEYHFISMNPHYLAASGIPEVAALAENTKEFEYDDALGMVIEMNDDKTVSVTSSEDIDSMVKIFNNDKFAVLEEKYFHSHYAFFISKRFLYWRETMTIISRLSEAGFPPSLYWRPSNILPLILRLTKPEIFHEFISLKYRQELVFDDIKGVFVLCICGCLAAVAMFFGELIRQFNQTEELFQKRAEVPKRQKANKSSTSRKPLQ